MESHSFSSGSLRSPQVVQLDPAEIGHQPSRALGRHESARVWRHRALAGVELFHGSYGKYDFARHYHAAATIGVVDHGVMRSWCRRAHHMAPAGSIILYNTEEVHAPGPGSDQGWSFRTFYLDQAFFRRVGSSLGSEQLSFSQPFVQDAVLAGRLLHLHSMFEESATSLELDSALLDILVALAKRYAGVVEPSSSAREDEKISRVRDYIHEHYWQDVTLPRLAEVAGLSLFHLLRAFRSAVGLTPHAYLIQTRIEAAKGLLRTGIAPAVVAVSTGFVDQSHLNRHFKRIVGATPGQYYPEVRTARPRRAAL